MHYKLYSYTIHDRDDRLIGPDRHAALFEQSRGKDSGGSLALYRGQKNAILMHLKKYHSDFTGLVGKFSTEREVTLYNNSDDETTIRTVGDEDYPHAAFIAFPRLGYIAVSDSGLIKADSAIERLHAIITSRTGSFFLATPYLQPIDLRKATRNFKVTEVNFVVNPVNPHTGDLGMQLDEDRKKDHIRKISGKMIGTASNPLKLNGGFLTKVQQLQQSGHSAVGFKAVTATGTEIQVPRPNKTLHLSEEDTETVAGEETSIRIEFKVKSISYPFTQGHIGEVRSVIKHLVKSDDEN